MHSIILIKPSLRPVGSAAHQDAKCALRSMDKSWCPRDPAIFAAVHLGQHDLLIKQKQVCFLTMSMCALQALG